MLSSYKQAESSDSELTDDYTTATSDESDDSYSDEEEESVYSDDDGCGDEAKRIPKRRVHKRDSISKLISPANSNAKVEMKKANDKKSEKAATNLIIKQDVKGILSSSASEESDGFGENFQANPIIRSRPRLISTSSITFIDQRGKDAFDAMKRDQPSLSCSPAYSDFETAHAMENFFSLREKMEKPEKKNGDSEAGNNGKAKKKKKKRSKSRKPQVDKPIVDDSDLAGYSGEAVQFEYNQVEKSSNRKRKSKRAQTPHPGSSSSAAKDGNGKEAVEGLADDLEKSSILDSGVHGV